MGSVMNDDNPYGLPQMPPPPPPPNPYGGQQWGAPSGPPPNPFAWQQNPYAPPTHHEPGPAWAQTFGNAQPLATPGARLGAHLLDGSLYFGAMMLAGVPGAAFGDEVAGALAVLGWIGLAAYQWYLLSTTGQTLGKKWLAIRVVKVDGSPVDFVSAVLLRSWAFHALTIVGIALVIGSVLPLVDALMIFGEDRRCLRDHLAGTKVVVA